MPQPPTDHWADPRVQAYLSVFSTAAQSMCAPFWWSVKQPGDPRARILHNGTICYVNTDVRELGITANHVYQQYLADLETYGSAAIECQFGSSTIYPEQRVIAHSKYWDIATFDVPKVFVSAGRNMTTHHAAPVWSPRPVQESEVVMYGGFPGSLREEKGSTAELPFQWVAARVHEVTEVNIVLEPDFATTRWLGTRSNDDPGGWSGGPVLRVDESGAIAHLELVGFIYAFSLEQAVLARHADVVLADGALR